MLLHAALGHPGATIGPSPRALQGSKAALIWEDHEFLPGDEFTATWRWVLRHYDSFNRSASAVNLRRRALPDAGGMLAGVEGLLSLDALVGLLNLTATSTIAVVGSSGNLVGSEYGAAIDSASVIIRCNAAVTEGYEADVGSRTDVRWAHEWGVEDTLYAQIPPAEEKLILQMTMPDKEIDGVPVMTADIVQQWKAETGRSNMAVALARWAQRMQGSLLGDNGEFPSTGFNAMAFAVVLAMHVGTRAPVVYGYGASRDCAKYFDCDGSKGNPARGGDAHDQQANAVNGWHPFATEAKVRAEWAECNLIELHGD